MSEEKPVRVVGDTEGCGMLLLLLLVWLVLLRACSISSDVESIKNSLTAPKQTTIGAVK